MKHIRMLGKMHKKKYKKRGVIGWRRHTGLKNSINSKNESGLDALFDSVPFFI